MRQLLIEEMKRQREEEFAELLRRLADMGLEPRGGSMTRLLVAEETAGQILEGVGLEQIERAMLDRDFRLDPPPFSNEEAD